MSLNFFSYKLSFMTVSLPQTLKGRSWRNRIYTDHGVIEYRKINSEWENLGGWFFCGPDIADGLEAYGRAIVNNLIELKDTIRFIHDKAIDILRGKKITYKPYRNSE